MDLVPSPAQVAAAAGNVVSLVARQGLADLRPTPREAVADGERHAVLRFRADRPVPPAGAPVLLVPPLAAPTSVYDLRRGCSLVEHLTAGGRPTYAVKLAGVSFRERDLDLAPWVDAVADSVRAASADAGDAPVHLAGWSLGGTLALLAAAREPDLPLASVVLLATPTDTTDVPMVAPDRPLPLHPLLRQAVRVTPMGRLLATPMSVATHLDDREFLAQVEAVARLGDQVPAYRGRSWGQLHHRFLPGNALATGAMTVGDRSIELASVTAPVLVLAGAEDGIAPLPAVRAVLAHLTGAWESVLEIVPGGHLGMLTGRGARDGTWPVLDEWLDRWSRPVRKQAPARRRPARKAAPKKTAAKKTATKKAPKKAPKKAAGKAAGRTAASDSPGTNPTRRYGSGSSRSLAP